MPHTSDLSAVAHIISSLTQAIRPPFQDGVTSALPTPLKTPSSMTTQSSPPQTHSPSDIHRYLTYAQDKLGVEDATTYLLPLQLKRYGPDILADVAVADLTAPDVGMAPGDALRLKRGSTDWWNHMAKRQRELDRQTLAGKSKATSSWDTPGPSSPKRHNTGSRSPRSPTTHDMSDLVPNLDRDPVRYEERWANGGRKRFYGTRIWTQLRASWP
jgi:hypothetical protein